MTIVDAIERAKRMGMSPPGVATRRPVDPATPAQDVGSQTATHRALTEHVPFDVLTLPGKQAGDSVIVALTEDSHVERSGAPPYRMLRARVLQRCRDNAWSTLAVTSPGPGEGKSVSTLNLAFSIAREGNYDVFLLDLDLRNPSICRYLGLRPRVEVADFFAGRATAHDVFFTIGGVERLAIAGGTQSKANASELLASGRLEELLAYIKSISARPLVLVDLPPVVSTDDALVVAPRMDSILLVVSEAVTRRDNLQRAVSLLSNFNMVGVVLNRTHESLGSHYYGT